MSPTFATRTDLESCYRTTVLICGVFLATLFVYPLVVELIQAQGGLGVALSAEIIEPMRYGGYALALVALGLGGAAKRVLAGRNSGSDMPALLRGLQSAVLAAYGLAEVPAVLGLVLFLLAGLRADFYLLWLLALAAMLVHFPRRTLWEDRARMARRELTRR